MPSVDSSCVWLPPWNDDDVASAARFGVSRAERATPSQWRVSRPFAGAALALEAPASEPALRLELDLRAGSLARRLRSAQRDQPLPRAIGLHRRRANEAPPHVLDATAGLGRDALLLAQLGCPVIAIERIPVLALLLADAARRAGLQERLDVRRADAVDVLAATAADDRPDVVFLDPMFAVAGKAQVKKEMQACRALAGPPRDTDVLFARAFAAARQRIVVKRHPHDLPLRAAPSFTVEGERVRFDVYLVAGTADAP